MYSHQWDKSHQKKKKKTIAEVIEYIKSKNKVNRKYSVNSEKICLMEIASLGKSANVYDFVQIGKARNEKAFNKQKYCQWTRQPQNFRGRRSWKKSTFSFKIYQNETTVFLEKTEMAINAKYYWLLQLLSA